jgi:hypothetical protein
MRLGDVRQLLFVACGSACRRGARLLPRTEMPPTEGAGVSQVTSHDWSRFGRHRLRAPDGVVIEVPFGAERSARLWVATLWPDARVADGWVRSTWRPDDTFRGWNLPALSAAGDVLEFGADLPGRPRRWYGILDAYEVDRWLTAQGPYTDPAAAHAAAQQLLAPQRFLPPLGPVGAVHACGRRLPTRTRCPRLQ